MAGSICSPAYPGCHVSVWDVLPAQVSAVDTEVQGPCSGFERPSEAAKFARRSSVSFGGDLQVLDQIEQERLATHGKGPIAELKEMVMPGNRKRITIGVLIFVFTQFAGSNDINVKALILFPHNPTWPLTENSTTPPGSPPPSASQGQAPA